MAWAVPHCSIHVLSVRLNEATNSIRHNREFVKLEVGAGSFRARRETHFSDFTADNDPHGEHDFGSFTLVGRKFFWKIEYYDKQCEFGPEDPADPEKTTRVLTVMLAEEY